jgi:flagellar motor component MotA
MTRKTFIAEYTRFITLAMKLAAKSQKQGIASLEEEIEDIDDELFKQGLRFIADGAEPRIIDEIMTNRIAHEKDKQTSLLKTVQKRAVLGLQAGEPLLIFYHVLLSLPGLTPKEEKRIEKLVLLRDDIDEEA